MADGDGNGNIDSGTLAGQQLGFPGFGGQRLGGAAHQRQYGIEGAAVLDWQKQHHGFAHQRRLRQVQQRSNRHIARLNHALGVAHQVAVGGEVK